MDLFLREAADRIGADDVLRKIDRLVNWQSFLPILKRGLKRHPLRRSLYKFLVPVALHGAPQHLSGKHMRL